MRTSKTVLFFTILVLIGFGLYHISRPRQQQPVVTPTANEPAIVTTYFCQEGMVKATYKGSMVTLQLPDNHTVTLSQSSAGSGVRYENGTTTFVSKGNSARLMEGDTTTFANCIGGTDVSNNGSVLFTDGSQAFSFNHGADVIISGGEIGYSPQWRNNTQSLGLLLAVGTIPRSVQPKTNLSDSKFTVGTSSDPQAVKTCLQATNGESAKGIAAIHGVQYSVFQLGDAGAGNYYDTTSYRTMRDGQCYAVEYTVHSTSLGAYSPDQGIGAFNKTAITTELESMARSFQFLQLSSIH